MSARQEAMEMLRRLLQGATIKIVRDRGHFVQISYKDTTVYIPPGLAHELQRTLFAIRDLHVQVNIEDYLRLGLPSTLEQCREFQKRRKAVNRAAHAAREARRRDEQRREAEERDLISEFFCDLTIQWEFVGFEEWTEPAWGPGGSEKVNNKHPSSDTYWNGVKNPCHSYFRSSVATTNPVTRSVGWKRTMFKAMNRHGTGETFGYPLAVP